MTAAPRLSPDEVELVEADAALIYERTRATEQEPGEAWPEWADLPDNVKALYRLAARNPYGLAGWQR